MRQGQSALAKRLTCRHDPGANVGPIKSINRPRRTRPRRQPAQLRQGFVGQAEDEDDQMVKAG